MNHVDSAFSTVETDPQSIVLLGIEPEKAEDRLRLDRARTVALWRPVKSCQPCQPLLGKADGWCCGKIARSWLSLE